MSEPLLEHLEAAWNEENATDEGKIEIPLRELTAFLRDIALRLRRLEEQAPSEGVGPAAPFGCPE